MTTKLMKLRVSAAVVACAGAMLWTCGQTAAQVQPPPAKKAAPATQAPARSERPTAAPTPAVQTQTPAVQTSARQSSDEVVARAAGIDIKADEVRAIIARLGQQEQAAVARDPALLGQVIRATLASQLVLNEALAKKWDREPNVVAQVERARENVIVESYLRSVTAVPEGFPSDADLQSVYDANQTGFLVPRQFHIAQIFVALAKDADKASEDKARRKVEEIQKTLNARTADFAAIAKAESEVRDGAERGGEIGWLTEAQIRPEIRAQVLGLAKGAVGEPVRLDDGWHILKLLDTQAARTRPLADVRDALVQRLRAERAEANRRAYLAEVLKRNPAAINELALSKLLEAPER